MDIYIDIVAEATLFFMQDRRAGLHGKLGVEHGRKKLRFYFEQAAALRAVLPSRQRDRSASWPTSARYRRGHRCRRDRRGDPRGSPWSRAFAARPPRVKTATTPGTASALSRPIGSMPRMGMRRAQHLQMQRVLRRHVERIARFAGDNDLLGEGTTQACAAGGARPLLDIELHAVQGVVDAVIAVQRHNGLENAGQIVARVLVEGCRGHDHACGAEAAFEGCALRNACSHGTKWCLFLARPSMVVTARLPRRDRPGRRQLWKGTPSSHTVQAPQWPRSAALLDAKPAVLAQERTRRHWPGRGVGRSPAVDGEVHLRRARCGFVRRSRGQVTLVGGRPVYVVERIGVLDRLADGSRSASTDGKPSNLSCIGRAVDAVTVKRKLLHPSPRANQERG